MDKTQNVYLMPYKGVRMKTKPIVHYKTVREGVKVGSSAILTPVDHPNHLPEHSVSNKGAVFTSLVQAYDPSTGRIETENTIYVPLKG